MTTIAAPARPVRRPPPPAPDRVLVVGPEGILKSDGGIVAGPDGRSFVPTSLLGCCHVAERLGYGQVWIHRDALGACGLPLELPAWVQGRRARASRQGLEHPFARADGWQSSTTGLRSWMTLWRPGPERARVAVAVPAWDDEREVPFASSVTPGELLQDLQTFARALGFGWWRNGGITSDAWLRDYYGPRIRRAEHPGAGALEEVNELPIAWHRRPTAREHDRAIRRLHSFDLNAQFLGAASSVALPAGPAEFVEHPLPEHVRGRPGVWRVDVRDDWAIGPREGSLPPLTRFTGPQWVAGPTAELLVQFGAAELVAGWTWPESHRYLEPWYRWLRDGRAELLEAGTAVPLAALKTIYARGLARLGSYDRANDADPLLQPYWRQAVLAEARCRWWRRLWTVARGPAGAVPVAVDADAAYYLTSSSSPESFARRVGLELGTGLGKLKAAGSTGHVARARTILAGGHTATVLRELRELKDPAE